MDAAAGVPASSRRRLIPLSSLHSGQAAAAWLHVAFLAHCFLQGGYSARVICRAYWQGIAFLAHRFLQGGYSARVICRAYWQGIAFMAHCFLQGGYSARVICRTNWQGIAFMAYPTYKVATLLV